MCRTARLVLTVPLYAIIALLAAVLALTTFSLGQNPTLARFLLRGTIPLENRAVILINQYPFVGTNFTVAQGVIILLVAVLVGVNLAMVATISANTEYPSSRAVLERSASFLARSVQAVQPAGRCSSRGFSPCLASPPPRHCSHLTGLGIAVVALLWILLSIYWVADGMHGGEVNGCPVDIYGR